MVTPVKVVNAVLRRFSARIPADLFHPALVAHLVSTPQPFRPLGIGNRTESLFAHTIKDIIVAQALIRGEVEKIKIGKVTFPTASVTLADAKNRLHEISLKCQESFSLKDLAADPHFMGIFNLFILYHDLGKQKDTRQDHEEKGASRFRGEREWFLQKGLTNSDLELINFMIHWHGLYGKIDAAKRKGLSVPTFEVFIEDLNSMDVKAEAKGKIAGVMFFFYIVEGLQSDIFSRDFYTPGKFEDIFDCYHQVIQDLRLTS